MTRAGSSLGTGGKEVPETGGLTDDRGAMEALMKTAVHGALSLLSSFRRPVIEFEYEVQSLETPAVIACPQFPESPFDLRQPVSRPSYGLLHTAPSKAAYEITVRYRGSRFGVRGILSEAGIVIRNESGFRALRHIDRGLYRRFS